MNAAAPQGPVARLLHSARRLAATLLESVHTRLDLLATEAE